MIPAKGFALKQEQRKNKKHNQGNDFLKDF